MNFVVLTRDTNLPKSGKNTAYLKIDSWNDYSFITMFFLALHDEKGILHKIGHVKIGFKGQTIETPTYSSLEDNFQQLPDGYFSVGVDVNYYETISELTEEVYKALLKALKDIVLDPELIAFAKEEDVFRTSLLRTVSLSVIKGQYLRVLTGRPPLTDFEFRFVRPATEKLSADSTSKCITQPI